MAGSYDPDEDLSGDFIRVTLPFIPVVTLAVAVRFWSRIINKEKLWWDDWCTLISWVMSILLLALGLAGTRTGIGRHIEVLSMDQLMTTGKLFYVSYIAFTIGACLVKSAALFFYARIFDVSPSFRVALRLCHILTALWFLSNMPLVISTCTPIARAWDHTKSGKCIDQFLFEMVEGGFDILLNLIILVLPMPMVLALHTSWRKKILLMAAFFLGYLALIPSIGRFISFAKLGHGIQNDFYSHVADLAWSFLEPGVCVISLCIPSWLQLGKRAHDYGLTSLFRHHEHAPESGQALRLVTPLETSSSFQRLHAEGVFDYPGRSKFQVEGGLRRESGSTEDMSNADNTIHVRRDITVTNEGGDPDIEMAGQ